MSETGFRAVLVASIVAAAIAIAAPATKAVAQAPPPTVTVAKPLAEKITQWDEFSGRFEAVESVEVRPRVSGFIETVHFRDGQSVKAGDPLFTVDQRPFEIEVKRAEATIQQRQAEVELQLSEVDRARPLVDSRTLTRRDFETREANLAVARAQLAAAQASLRAASLDLEWATVRAPIAGRLSDRRVNVGELVTGGAGASTVLTSIVSLDPIYFVFDGSEADYLRYIRLAKSGARPSSRDEGNPVRIKLADESEWSRTGKMDFVDNRLDARSGTIRGRAILDNPDRFLTPGMFGRLELFGGDFDALLVPDKAIVSDQTRKIVFVVGDDNVVAARPVELGQLQPGGLRVIKSGLDADANVVINGIANPAVRPGAKVTPEAGAIVAAEAG